MTSSDPQRRWTVALRIILVIPHLLVVSIVGIAALVVIIAAWFAALVRGRLPDGMASFLLGFLRYWARVIGYGQYLLTDQYPRFAFTDPDHPIEVDVTSGQLNRLAVLFRLILIIPAGIVSTLASQGAYIGAFIAWVILIITGRMPQTLFEALAAVFRYGIRVFAYGSMLTSVYPGELFGDTSEVALSAPPPPDDVEDQAPEFLSERPRVTRLVLSTGAKRLIVVFLVLGAVWQVGSYAIGFSEAGDAATANTLIEENNELGTAAERFSAESSACQSLECLQQARSRFADAVADFGAELDDADIPGDAAAERAQMKAVTTQLEDALRNDDPRNPERVQGLLFAFDDAFNALINALRT